MALQQIVVRKEQPSEPIDPLAISVKSYYIKTERYDWVAVARGLKGIESFFHMNRRMVVKKFFGQFGRNGAVLDAGCGTGLNLTNLPAGSVGLDINPWNVQKARNYAPQASHVVGDLEMMPFRDGAFSTAICTECLEHVPDSGQALSELKRVLKKRGRLIGSVPRRTWLWRFRQLSSTCPHSEPFHNQYTSPIVKRMLSRFHLLRLRNSTLGLNLMFVAES